MNSPEVNPKKVHITDLDASTTEGVYVYSVSVDLPLYHACIALSAAARLHNSKHVHARMNELRVRANRLIAPPFSTVAPSLAPNLSLLSHLACRPFLTVFYLLRHVSCTLPAAAPLLSMQWRSRLMWKRPLVRQTPSSCCASRTERYGETPLALFIIKAEHFPFAVKRSWVYFRQKERSANGSVPFTMCAVRLHPLSGQSPSNHVFPFSLSCVHRAAASGS